MCGRFTYEDSSSIASTYDCELISDEDGISFPTHYNACPATHIPVIRGLLNTDGTLHKKIDLMQWGLIPDWAKIEAHRGFINARSETVHSKPSFKESFLMRRCVVPARGYYEWNTEKQPFYIHLADGALSFAAIWDGGNSGINPTVAILTSEATALSHIHPRHPVALTSEDALSLWLHPTTDSDVLRAILSESSDRYFIAHEVDKRIGNPQYNDSSLILALDKKQ